MDGRKAMTVAAKDRSGVEETFQCGTGTRQRSICPQALPIAVNNSVRRSHSTSVLRKESDTGIAGMESGRRRGRISESVGEEMHLRRPKVRSDDEALPSPWRARRRRQRRRANAWKPSLLGRRPATDEVRPELTRVEWNKFFDNGKDDARKISFEVKCLLSAPELAKLWEWRSWRLGIGERLGLQSLESGVRKGCESVVNPLAVKSGWRPEVSNGLALRFDPFSSRCAKLDESVIDNELNVHFWCYLLISPRSSLKTGNIPGYGTG